MRISRQCPLCAGQSHYFSTSEERDYFECEVCQLIFADPDSFLNKAEEKERYELHENDPEDERYRNFLGQVLEPLLPHLEQGQTGLDFGCGPGPALKLMLEEHGMNMRVYDPFYFRKPQTLQQEYDFVTCTEVVEHFYDPAQDWQTLVNLVKPGGYLAIMTSLCTNEIDFHTWHYKLEPSHVMFYHPETMHFIANTFGLTIKYLESPIILFAKP